MLQPLQKTGWWFFKNLSIELQYNPAIPRLSIYPQKLKPRTQTDICMPLFISAYSQCPKNGNTPNV
jgi:hypothetical protein